MFELKAINRFEDLEASEKEGKQIIRKPGDIFIVNNPARARMLAGDNSRKIKYAEITKGIKQCPTTDTNEKIVIYQNYLYIIGGIETFLFNLVKNFRHKDITIICENIEYPQLVNLSKYANVMIDDHTKIECDVLILGNYNCDTVLSRANAKKVYQMIHADWRGIKQIPAWSNFTWRKDSRIDEIICVSENAAQGLKETMGYDSKVIYNILDNNYKEDEGLTFITLSRATAEKGIFRIVEMAKRFREAGKSFTWFLCCTMDQVTDRKIKDAIKSMPELIIVPPDVKNKMLIKNCDYLVQLSDTESFCYSAYEALQREVPVILTRFPEAYNIVDEGQNGYLVEMDLSDLDVEKIFNEIPPAKHYIDRCNIEDWEKVFKGEF